MNDYRALAEDLREMEYRAMMTIVDVGVHSPLGKALTEFATECFVFRCELQFQR